jgi:hypothetical protein
MFAQVLSQVDRETAARFALGLITDLESSERQLALSVILAR